jgi:hypothetical protein
MLENINLWSIVTLVAVAVLAYYVGTRKGRKG